MPLARFSVIVACLIPVCLVPACTTFPELDTHKDPAIQAAAYPTLLPLDSLLTTQTVQVTPELRAGIESRIGALRNRAAGLQRPVVDSATRTRMQRGISAPF